MTRPSTSKGMGRGIDDITRQVIKVSKDIGDHHNMLNHQGSKIYGEWHQ
jgi:hypothetical protein